MATYKLEDDADRWWQSVVAAEGEGFEEALAWRDFLDIFYKNYFPIAEREAYKREFLHIKQEPKETITKFMERFIRVAGIVGAVAGSAADQAEKFKWAFLFEYRHHLVTINMIWWQMWPMLPRIWSLREPISLLASLLVERKEVEKIAISRGQALVTASLLVQVLIRVGMIVMYPNQNLFRLFQLRQIIMLVITRV